MNDRIKGIIEEINNKYQDYYIDDFLSGDDVKLLVDYLNKSQKEINKLNNMEQYPIERDLFTEIFHKIYIDYYDSFFNTTTENFKLWYSDDSFYILHLPSGTLITWYKHLGRCLECNKDLSIEEYQWLANELEKELKGSK